jgi:NAD(P)-dependent dehydrogenase (short-subunit alcohol dehydrogenase family)
MHGAEQLIAAATDNFGAIDILINNAGALNTATILEMTEEQWDDEIGVQLRGAFCCTSFAVKAMVAQGRGGRIMNMAGGAGVRGFYANANHAASKGGLLAATYTWALELERYGITVNALRGQVRSEGTDPLVAGIRARLEASGHPLPDTDEELGFFDPDDTLPPILWLASEASNGVTGRFIGIDGKRITIWGLAQPVASFLAAEAWTPDMVSSYVLPTLKGLAASTGAGELNPYLALLAQA